MYKSKYQEGRKDKRKKQKGRKDRNEGKRKVKKK
jgi:hypothetical protein